MIVWTYFIRLWTIHSLFALFFPTHWSEISIKVALYTLCHIVKLGSFMLDVDFWIHSVQFPPILKRKSEKIFVEIKNQQNYQLTVTWTKQTTERIHATACLKQYINRNTIQNTSTTTSSSLWMWANCSHRFPPMRIRSEPTII